MKKINYESIIPNFVGPKLAYHGFKYDEAGSYPPEGHYCFTREYWCTPQQVLIGPIQYDVETVAVGINENQDSPIEVPRPLLLIQESGFRLWLSSKYILAVLKSGDRAVDLLPNQGISVDTEPPANAEDLVRKLKGGPPFQAGKALSTWWEFNGEYDLRRVLSKIVQITVNEGLEWFESMVTDIRRYHEKLDRRKHAISRNLARESDTE